MNIEPWVPVFYESEGFGIQEWITIGVGVGSAILGAAVGGLLANAQAKQQRIDQDNREEKAELARKKAIIIRAQFQASMILSDVMSTIDGINSSLEHANARGLSGQPLFTRMLPLIGVMATPPLDMEAIGVLTMAGADDLIAAYAEMHFKHDVLIQAIRRFDSAKDVLNEKVAPLLKTGPNGAFLELTAAQQAPLVPYFEGAESLAKDIRRVAEELKALAETAAFKTGPWAREYFKDPKFPMLVAHAPDT